MGKCKNCLTNDGIKYSKYSSGNFCSLHCAKSFSSKEKRIEINKKVSLKLTGRPHVCNYDRIKKVDENRTKKYNDLLLSVEYSTLKFERLKKRIILEQNNKCNRCGIDNWLNQKISLEIEHIDGNHHNNDRNNLEALCPNCHSLTPTWRGRNKATNKNKVNDNDLLKKLIEHNFNIRQALLSLGFAAKGGNYKRCYRLKNEYDNT